MATSPSSALSSNSPISSRDLTMSSYAASSVDGKSSTHRSLPTRSTLRACRRHSWGSSPLSEPELEFEEPLDCEQRRAVEAPERAIAVLAGPGSGKTRVLSYRARHLLQQDRRAKA